MDIISTIKHFLHELITFKYRNPYLWIINVLFLFMKVKEEKAQASTLSHTAPLRCCAMKKTLSATPTCAFCRNVSSTMVRQRKARTRDRIIRAFLKTLVKFLTELALCEKRQTGVAG